MRRIAAIIAALCVGTLHAQTLYQCAGKTGNSYQQVPCAASMRLVRTRETAPEPPPTAGQLAQLARKASEDRAESAFLSHLAGTDIPPPAYRSSGVRSGRGSQRNATTDACSVARASRTRTLRMVGLDRTMELLSRLDADVADACGRR